MLLFIIGCVIPAPSGLVAAERLVSLDTGLDTADTGAPTVITGAWCGPGRLPLDALVGLPASVRSTNAGIDLVITTEACVAELHLEGSGALLDGWATGCVEAVIGPVLVAPDGAGWRFEPVERAGIGGGCPTPPVAISVGAP